MRARSGGRRLALAAGAVLAAFAAGLFIARGRPPDLSRPASTPPVAASAVSAPWFRESAAAAGLDFRHVSGSTRHLFPEIMGGGACFLDYDGDNLLDLYLVQSGELSNASSGNRLYHNVGGGRFEDVSREAGAAGAGYGMGCSCGDYDGDGHVDIYVTNVGRDLLYRNRGDGSFGDVTQEAGLGNPLWSTSSAFLDYDRDGDLDLFVANYVHWSAETDIECFNPQGTRDYCSPNSYKAPAAASLYQNLGDGRFEDVSESAGITSALGNGLGVTHGDFDRNGWLDIFVANDGSPNHLWLNEGNGHFREAALMAGCAVSLYGAARAGMGVAAFDLDDDADLDLFLTQLRNEGNTCYRYEDGAFSDVTASTGLGSPSLPFTGFGTGLADFDQDGRLDVFVANGGVRLEGPGFGQNDLFAQPDQLYRGLDGATFAVLPSTALDGAIRTSRAAAFADYDGDGDIDVVVVDRDAPVRLLQNVHDGPGDWIMFRVEDSAGREALGALVGVRLDDGRLMWRQVQRAYSYLASNDPRVHFGLGKGLGAPEVRVRWLGGAEELFGSLEPGRVHTLREGRGQ